MLGNGGMSKRIEVRGDVAVIKDFNPQNWGFNGSWQNLVCDKIYLFIKYIKCFRLIIFLTNLCKTTIYYDLYASVYSYIVCLCLSKMRECV